MYQWLLMRDLHSAKVFYFPKALKLEEIVISVVEKRLVTVCETGSRRATRFKLVGGENYGASTYCCLDSQPLNSLMGMHRLFDDKQEDQSTESLPCINMVDKTTNAEKAMVIVDLDATWASKSQVYDAKQIELRNNKINKTVQTNSFMIPILLSRKMIIGFATK
ncbi:hypothetical protein M8C21_015293, partial [Ambrosia artemisiifolia]